MEEISWNDFEKVEIRVGTVVQVDDFPEARKPAYILRVDFGPEIGVRKSSAQVTQIYDKGELLG
jgi:tRNA-binding protein